MHEIEKRLQEIEQELRELYNSADAHTQLSSNRSKIEEGWLALQERYSSIGALAAGFSEKCMIQLADFREWDKSQKEKFLLNKKQDSLFSFCEYLLLNAPWAPSEYSSKDYKLQIRDSKANITYKGEFITLTDSEQESLYRLWAKNWN